jgi:6-pyruvoyltetrahydropterin/6-carboxytetrahydropterin synthase
MRPQTYKSTIRLESACFSFSSGHFTIFSAEKRERLHGHRFTVACTMETQVGSEGLSFDYGFYKKEIERLCESLDEYFLLPQHNPHLQLQTEGTHVRCTFAGQWFLLPEEDVKILPVANITVEELSRWLAGRLHQTCGAYFDSHGIRSCTVEVSSGPGQRAAFAF